MQKQNQENTLEHTNFKNSQNTVDAIDIDISVFMYGFEARFIGEDRRQVTTGIIIGNRDKGLILGIIQTIQRLYHAFKLPIRQTVEKIIYNGTVSLIRGVVVFRL